MVFSFRRRAIIETVLLRSKRSRMISDGKSIKPDNSSICSSVKLASEGMAYSDSAGALRASVAPFRSLMTPREAGSLSVRTKRLLPSSVKNS